MSNNIENLKDAIEADNVILVEELLEQGVNPNGDDEYDLVFSAYDTYEESRDISILALLLEYGANPDIGYVFKEYDSILSFTSSSPKEYLVTKLLVNYGANPNLRYLDGPVLFGTLQNDDNLENMKLILSYGGLQSVNRHYIPPLDFAIWKCNIKEIKLLLNNGADLTNKTEFEDTMLQTLEKNKEKYTKMDYQELQHLLNPNNPPYLKLGEKEEDKYIIYENKKTDEEYNIYLLADKKIYKDKNYLYADNKIDAFVYWCYKNELLTKSVMKAIKTYEDTLGEINTKNINKLIISTIGEQLTTDSFTEDGKDFATAYLTVTHWWYSLHYDFNRLYQDEEIKLPRAVKSQEEFDTLMKLLDIRHEQFKSGKDFNSNQNKEELQALIEGKEPPKRVVDLSFLEEKEEFTQPQNNNTIPDDFMK
jgi:hypothetical protein